MKGGSGNRPAITDRRIDHCGRNEKKTKSTVASWWQPPAESPVPIHRSSIAMGGLRVRVPHISILRCGGFPVESGPPLTARSPPARHSGCGSPRPPSTQKSCRPQSFRARRVRIVWIAFSTISSGTTISSFTLGSRSTSTHVRGRTPCAPSAPMSARLQNRHSLHANLHQRVLHRIQLRWLDHCFDLLHLIHPLVLPSGKL